MPLVRRPGLDKKFSPESWIFDFFATFDRLVSDSKAVLGFCGGFWRFWGLFLPLAKKVEKNETPDSFSLGKKEVFLHRLFRLKPGGPVV